MKRFYVLFIVLILCSAQFVIAQIPKTMNYQGLLTDGRANLLNGDYTITFNMYESAQEGVSIWQEAHNLAVAEGMFNVILGSSNPLNLSFNKPYWLGITIGRSTELKPRIELSSSPYSLNAQTVSDSSITSKKIADKQLVRSINSITDNLFIKAGKNVNIVQKGDSLIISASTGNINGPKKPNTGDVSQCTTTYYVYTLNNLKGHLSLKTTGGAEIYDDGSNTLTIKAGKGNIKKITNTDNTLDIINPEGKYAIINVKEKGITETQLADNSVTNQKLAADAVTSSNIVDNTIASNDLADDAVITQKIHDNAVSMSKLADSSVTSLKIKDASIAGIDITDNAVTSAKIADAAVGPTDLSNNAVTTAKIADKAVTQAKIDPAVSLPPGGPAGGDLTGTYPNPMINSSSVTGAKIADGTVEAVDLANNTITGTKILDGTVGPMDLSDNAVTSAKLTDAAVTTAKIADKTVTQAKLAAGVTLPPGGPAGGDLAGAYPNPVIANNAVTTSKISNGAVTQAKLDPAVTAQPGGPAGGDLSGVYPNPIIKSAAVTGAKIAAGEVVKSLNNLKDNVTLAAGTNMTITPAGNTLTLSAAGADNDWTIAGNDMYSGVSGNVGIGTASPAQKLDINGTAKMTGFQLPTGASNGYVLTTDQYGIAAWQPAAGGIGGSGTAGYIPMFTGPAALGNSFVYQSGSRLGVGTNNPDSKLHVDGGTEIRSGYFTSDRLENSTRILHSEYTGPSGPRNVTAVYGSSMPRDGYGTGGFFQGGREGIGGWVFPTGNLSYMGVRGYVSGGSGDNYGVHSYVSGDGRNYGLMAQVRGYGNSTNYGIYAYATGGSANYAGYFNGTLYASNLTGGVKSFKIDHPLDPENKYLYHSSVESPDMMNIYNGNVELNSAGEAWVDLPEWFGSLNEDFRYQLTCIGGFAQVYIAEKVKNNRFKIAGGNSGLEVSWQITGIRKDPAAVNNRISVEQLKGPAERGKYLNPKAYGKPESMGVAYDKKLSEDNKIEKPEN